MKKLFLNFGLFLTAAILFSPLAGQAQSSPTLAELKARIEFLNQQIGELQKAYRIYRPNMTGMTGMGRLTTGASCLNLIDNLAPGRRDPAAPGTILDTSDGEVLKAQKFLRDRGYFSGDPTGFYGPQTEQAVKDFQTAVGIVSSGDSATTGFGLIGPATRQKIREMTCGQIPLGAGVAGASLMPPGGGILPPQTVVIPPPGQSYLMFTSPAGGESWVQGSVHTLTWSSNLPTTDRLVLRLKNAAGSLVGLPLTIANLGRQLITVSADLPAGAYRYELAPIAGDQSWTANSGLFNVVSPATPTFYFTSPQGGEVWAVGTTHNLTWVKESSLSSPATLVLKRADGVVIGAPLTIPNSGAYSALLPNDLAVGNYRYEISATTARGARITIGSGTFQAVERDTGTNLSGADAARPSLMVALPVGGESYVVGNTIMLTWSTNIAPTQRFDLKLKNSAGLQIGPIASGVVNTGSYAYTLPSTLTPGSYRLELSTTIGGTALVANSGLFSVTAMPSPSLNFVSPVGGESWMQGTTHTLTWTSNLPSANQLTLKLKNSYGGEAAASVSIFNTGSYTVTIPASLAPGSYRYELSGVSLAGVAVTAGSGTFTVAVRDTSTSSAGTPSGSAYVSITAPQGGESYQPGGAVTLTWISTGLRPSTVDLKLKTVGGIAVGLPVTVSNSGIYSYRLPSTLTPGSYRLELSTTVGGSPVVAGSGTFTVSALPSPSLNFISPAGGESWMQGTTHTLTWTSNLPSANQLTLKLKNSYGGEAAASVSISNTGSYTVTIPATLALGQYRYKLSGVSTAGVSFIASSGLFNVIAADDRDTTTDTTAPTNYSLSFISPAGGESWRAGESTTLSWTSNLPITNRLTLRLKNSYGTVMGSAETIANAGNYSTVLPANLASGSYRYEISTAIGGTALAANSGLFSVTAMPSPSLNFISPAGGESWLVGRSYNLSWTSNLSSDARLTLKLKNSYGGEAAASVSIFNTGSYTVTIPASLAPGSYRYEISGVSLAGVAVTAGSGTFTVSAASGRGDPDDTTY